MKESVSDKRVLLLSFFTLACYSIFDSPKGLFLPLFKETYQINNTQMGTIILIGSMVYMISSYLAGVAHASFGSKNLLLVSILGESILAWMLSYSSSVYVFAIIYCGFSLFGGFLVFGINTLVPQLKIRNHAYILNCIYACYSFSAVATAKGASAFVSRGFSWQSYYRFSGSLLLLLFLMIFLTKYPTSHKLYLEKKKRNRTFLRDKRFYLYMIGFGFFLSSERVMGNWLANYVVEGFDFSIEMASRAVMIYFSTVGIGRIFGGLFIERVGKQRFIRVSLGLAFGVAVIGIALGQEGIWFLAGIGLFFSTIYATTVILIQEEFKEDGVQVMGVILATNAIMISGMNYMIGMLNDHLGVRVGIFIMPFNLMIAWLAHQWIAYKKRSA